MRAIVELKRTGPEDADLLGLVKLLDKELRASNGDVQDVLDQYNVIKESFRVVVAYAGGNPVACGCFKEFEPGAVEIKRMFVVAEYRGRGVAMAILGELERWATELGNTRTVLETGTRLVGAINLYKKAGYSVRAQYGQYIDMENSVCMEKLLEINATVA